MAGDVQLTNTNQYDFQRVMARFEQRGKKFCARGRHLKHTEWRSMVESPGELLLRETRAADLSPFRATSTGAAQPVIEVLFEAQGEIRSPAASARLRASRLGVPPLTPPAPSG
jgi:hypothetical protein